MASSIDASVSGAGGLISTADNSGVLQLKSGGTTVSTINAYGIGLGSGVPSSGIGITFPSTQSASSDANTLDDYEEGTWTPALTCETPGTFSYTVSDAQGDYIKIGKVVHFSFLLGWSALSVGTGTGALQISGLPFTSSSTQNFLCPVQTYQVNWIASTTCIVGQVLQTNTKMMIRCLINDGDWSAMTITSQTASQQNYIRMSGSYITA